MSLMRLNFTFPLAFATASLLFANASSAATYNETGDAGDLPATAQVASGTAGTALTAISGSTTLTNEISDSDMYEILITSPTTFSASTTAFIQGANNFDTQLALFSVTTSTGVITNDDAASGGSQSNIAAGSLTAANLPGLYYLLISGSGRYAVSSTGLIFPNYTDGTTDPTGTYGPTGPGGGNAISGYTGSSNEAGSYVIALTGAQFIPAVPEPGTYACILASAAGLVLITRARRTAK